MRKFYAELVKLYCKNLSALKLVPPSHTHCHRNQYFDVEIFANALFHNKFSTPIILARVLLAMEFAAAEFINP